MEPRLSVNEVLWLRNEDRRTAREELLAELRQKVEALPELTLFEQGDGPHLDRAAVLALLDTPERGAGPE